MCYLLSVLRQWYIFCKVCKWQWSYIDLSGDRYIITDMLVAGLE